MGPGPPIRHEVLEDISLTINGDTSCALMGPSGSGKSSLLNVLTGRALLYGEVSGRLFANGELIPEGIEAKCKNATGFVPQDDVMHTNLTVYENVYFSARLRLPPDTKAQDVVDTVEQVLKDVGIWHVKDTPVGNADLRGISGGQRKRASIAMELVGRPSVLFLDEPTSGLDASAAHSIITRLSFMMELQQSWAWALLGRVALLSVMVVENSVVFEPSFQSQLLPAANANTPQSQADLRQVSAALHQYCRDPPTSLEDLSLLRSSRFTGNGWLPGLLWPSA